MKKPKLSALSLAPVRKGQTPKEAIESMIKLAQYLESIDYERFWIAEHHNMPHLVSSATQILVGQTLEKTQKIRVGSGGVMLPNHSPLQVAEQYGTLHTLYPNRVDLGLGRAPGTDPLTALALRRGNRDVSLEFEKDIAELQQYFGDELMQGKVKAYPALGLNVPLYILGSSTESAFLAGRLGLPYAFASHFAPQLMEVAVDIYRREFKSSSVLAEPYVMVCVNAIVAETNEESKILETSVQQLFWDLVRANPRPVQPPVENMDSLWNDREKILAMNMLKESLVGDVESVKKQLIILQNRVSADELMLINYIYDETKQYRSYQLFKQMIDEL